ncbi:hypothetical protein BC628DRAFT_371210 [Trametes gibbosa]|nr:hypothetical protein BC628DRAFT_371210 [Trametes gibbosa]
MSALQHRPCYTVRLHRRMLPQRRCRSIPIAMIVARVSRLDDGRWTSNDDGGRGRAGVICRIERRTRPPALRGRATCPSSLAIVHHRGREMRIVIHPLFRGCAGDVLRPWSTSAAAPTLRDRGFEACEATMIPDIQLSNLKHRTASQHIHTHTHTASTTWSIPFRDGWTPPTEMCPCTRARPSIPQSVVCGCAFAISARAQSTHELSIICVGTTPGPQGASGPRPTQLRRDRIRCISVRAVRADASATRHLLPWRSTLERHSVLSHRPSQHHSGGMSMICPRCSGYPRRTSKRSSVQTFTFGSRIPGAGSIDEVSLTAREPPRVLVPCKARSVIRPWKMKVSSAHSKLQARVLSPVPRRPHALTLRHGRAATGAAPYRPGPVSGIQHLLASAASDLSGALCGRARRCPLHATVLCTRQYRVLSASCTITQTEHPFGPLLGTRTRIRPLPIGRPTRLEPTPLELPVRVRLEAACRRLGSSSGPPFEAPARRPPPAAAGERASRHRTRRTTINNGRTLPPSSSSSPPRVLHRTTSAPPTPVRPHTRFDAAAAAGTTPSPRSPPHTRCHPSWRPRGRRLRRLGLLARLLRARTHAHELRVREHQHTHTLSPSLARPAHAQWRVAPLSPAVWETALGRRSAGTLGGGTS